MITLKDGRKFKDVRIGRDGMMLEGEYGNAHLTPREYADQWAKGVINPLPDDSQTAWKTEVLHS